MCMKLYGFSLSFSLVVVYSTALEETAVSTPRTLQMPNIEIPFKRGLLVCVLPPDPCELCQYSKSILPYTAVGWGRRLSKI